MPASRKARATTLMPRSWPSRPTLASTTRMGAAEVGMRIGSSKMRGLPRKSLPLGRTIITAEHVRQSVHEFTDRAPRLGRLQKRRHQVFTRAGHPAEIGQRLPNG